MLDRHVLPQRAELVVDILVVCALARPFSYEHLKRLLQNWLRPYVAWVGSGGQSEVRLFHSHACALDRQMLGQLVQIHLHKLTLHLAVSGHILLLKVLLVSHQLRFGLLSFSLLLLESLQLLETLEPLEIAVGFTLRVQLKRDIPLTLHAMLVVELRLVLLVLLAWHLLPVLTSFLLP